MVDFDIPKSLTNTILLKKDDVPQIIEGEFRFNPLIKKQPPFKGIVYFSDITGNRYISHDFEVGLGTFSYKVKKNTIW